MTPDPWSSIEAAAERLQTLTKGPPGEPPGPYWVKNTNPHWAGTQWFWDEESIETDRRTLADAFLRVGEVMHRRKGRFVLREALTPKHPTKTWYVLVLLGDLKFKKVYGPTFWWAIFAADAWLTARESHESEAKGDRTT